MVEPRTARRRRLVAASAALAALALAITILDDGPTVPRAPSPGELVAEAEQIAEADCPPPRRGAWRRGASTRRAVAITFDDGPGAETPKVLRALRRHDARATFFPLGREVPGREGMLRRAAHDGHEIGNHSTSHDELPSAGDIAATSDLVAELTGRAPCVFRPPGGALSARLLRIAHRLGMTTVLWDVDPADWAMQDPRVLRERVRTAAEPGSIILMHDGGGSRAGTASSVSALIADLRAAGYELVTVSELLEGASASEPGALADVDRPAG